MKWALSSRVVVALLALLLCLPPRSGVALAAVALAPITATAADAQPAHTTLVTSTADGTPYPLSQPEAVNSSPLKMVLSDGAPMRANKTRGTTNGWLATDPWESRILVLSNLDGDILRFKSQLVLAGVAELVPVDGDNTTAPITDNDEDATVRFMTPARDGESPNQAKSRVAIARRAQAKLTHLRTGKLRLTDACSNTLVVLLGNSVGTHPHSHEIIDTFAQLRREGIETKLNCQLYYLVGTNEVRFLSGDFDFLSPTSTTLPSTREGDDTDPTSAAVVTEQVQQLGTRNVRRVVSVTEIRRRQQSRQVLAAFADNLDMFKESYSPYGAYGRFLLNNLVVLRVGDTVFSHGGITRDYAASGAHGINAFLLASFKATYDDITPTTTTTTQPPEAHAKLSDRLGQPLNAVAGALTVTSRSASASTAEEALIPSVRGSPLSDQSLVLAAALDGDCAPVHSTLELLSRAESQPVRRMVVAGNARTAAKVRAKFGDADSPLTAPISQLCDGALVVVAGGERPESPLSLLRLQRTTQQAAAEAGFTARALYPAGAHALPVFAHRRQPIAQPLWGRTVRTVAPQPAAAAVDGDDDDSDEAADWPPARLVQQLHVRAGTADGGAEAAQRAAVAVVVNDVMAGATVIPVSPEDAVARRAAANGNRLGIRAKQQWKGKNSGKAVLRTTLQTAALAVVLSLAVVVALACFACAWLTQARPHIRVSFFKFLRHDKSQ